MAHITLSNDDLFAHVPPIDVPEADPVNPSDPPALQVRPHRIETLPSLLQDLIIESSASKHHQMQQRYVLCHACIGAAHARQGRQRGAERL